MISPYIRLSKRNNHLAQIGPDGTTFGDTWVHEARSPLLKVPSIVANKLEFNDLINPAHPQFPLIAEQDATPFAFDPRFIYLG